MPEPDDKHTPPTLLHETRVFAGKLFQVDVQDVRLPSGQKVLANFANSHTRMRNVAMVQM